MLSLVIRKIKLRSDVVGIVTAAAIVAEINRGGIDRILFAYEEGARNARHEDAGVVAERQIAACFQRWISFCCRLMTSLLRAMVLVGILGELFGDDAKLLQTDDDELNGQRTQ